MVPKKARGELVRAPDFEALLAPCALLTFGGGNDQGLVVRFGGVIVNRGCGLRTQVSGLRIEIERGDAVGTVRAGELHAALNALDSIGFHCLNCSLLGVGASTLWSGSEGNDPAIRGCFERARAQPWAAVSMRAWTGAKPAAHQRAAGNGGVRNRILDMAWVWLGHGLIRGPAAV